MDCPSIEALALDFRDLSTFLHGGGSAREAQRRLVELATRSISGCDWAGITVRPRDRPAYSLITRPDVVRQVDEYQYAAADGPCLEAARTGEPVLSRDLEEETRWPQFRRRVLERTPVRGVLSFHLTDSPSPTALNLYSSGRDGLDDDATTTASLFATHASVMMVHAESAHQAATLGAALSTSRQIGAATGILMALHKISEDQAYELLRIASNRLNRKLRDVAQDVTESGSLPGGH